MAALVISQHTIMSAAMLNAKRARMKVEADRQLLANRIARLQAEEMKSVKRIEETHRRTQEILLLKTRQQQGELEKEAVKDLVAVEKEVVKDIRLVETEVEKDVNALEKEVVKDVSGLFKGR